MKTNNKKAPSSTWKANKFGHVPLTIKGIKSIFKFDRPLPNQAAKSYGVVGFTRIEKEEAAMLEAEASRDKGRVYANITPIR